MKNLLLVTFAWLMMMAIIGSIVYTMLYVVENYSSGHNESIQYLWCCFTGVLLIPAYKGVYYIHSLWIKMLKEFREGGAPKEDDSKEIPFFKEPTPTVSVNITEYPFVENRKKNIPAPPSLEEINEAIKNIRSSANEKLSQIKKEDITKPTKDSSYFAQKYTEEKSILVDTIFAKEKQSQTSPATPSAKSKEETATKTDAEAILKPKAAPIAKPEEKPISKEATATAASQEVKKEDTSHKDETPASKHTHKGGKKHYHKKGGKR